MRVAFVENHDSFSWNVIDCLPVARSNIDIVTPAQAIDQMDRYGAVVLGPGPTDPVRAGLIDVVLCAASKSIPMLGICLGHQAIGLAFGAQIKRSDPAHGKCAEATFQPSTNFKGIVGAHKVMRYHSLSLHEVKPPLTVIATLSDKTVMGIEHETLPMAGLQFHPDSYATENGRKMIAAFFKRQIA